jgi:hypothetical protein
MSKKDEIVKIYSDHVKKNSNYPTVSDMVANGITRHTIRHHFGNMTRLHQFIKDNNPEVDDVITEEFIFTKKNLELLRSDLKKYKRFFITTMVSGKPVDLGFLKSIEQYCKINDAKLLILPCMDIASRQKDSDWVFPKELSDEAFVFDDVRLNSNFYINTIRLSAKHINPLTGLSRIGQRNGTFVYASPKQFLEFVATSSSKNRIPHALMTTGAITKSDYSSDLYMSQRTSYIADNDHVIGGVVVEIVDDDIFHFRQVQADSHGAFIDLCVKYSGGELEPVRPSLVMGDYHAGATDQVVKETTIRLMDELAVKDLFLHDFFDGYCISHHDFNEPGRMAKKAMNDNLNLKKELQCGCHEVNNLMSHITGNIVMVKSNHDEWLSRYLTRGTYVKDNENHYHSLLLARAMLDGDDPLEVGYRSEGIIKEPDRVIWLDRDDEFKIANVELAAHGDLGANGARASLNSLEKAYGNCVVGHTHSAAIYRGVFRVGTSTKMNLDYNKGPSSWTHTHCLVYPNGSRQLINIINGEYKL